MALRFILISLFAFRMLNAQITCKGMLIDSLSKEPLEFANVGILGKGLGSVSNEKGEFEFKVPDSLVNETLKISLIGYKSIQLKVSEVQNGKHILLPLASIKLEEVQVNPKKVKIKILGNETSSKAVSGGFKSNLLGAEMGVRLNIKHPDTYLRTLKFHINSNTLGKTPIFRVNVYAKAADGMPGENILKQNIIIEPKDTVGMVEVDLKPYLVFVSDDVFVTLEWIKDLGNATGLYFSTKLVGSATYFRTTSQAKWEKVSPVGVGLHVEVGY
ncbi:MAG: carboxypeptidase-like regulatory domain-containing protein [Bacteroidia bacterium]|jgi:hypothetical protein|nr:carboxypeptidase-like regulatory domain-containing protein [Bacteroidia bacterium]